MIQKSSIKKIPLSRIVTVPPKSRPSSNIEYDNITRLDNYIPSASTFEIVERLFDGISGIKKSGMISVTGPYGSGKSTMAVFLKGLLAPNGIEWKAAYDILKAEPRKYLDSVVNARRKYTMDKKGIICCVVMARREPLPVTILRGLASGFTDYFGKKLTGLPNRKLFYDCMRNMKKHVSTEDILKIIKDASKKSPILLMIDEFGKNIEYFATDESREGDMFLLQELAEMSGKDREVPLYIITLQHMAFEEYATGASIAVRKEWAKIQGRFEDIPFANSPEQTRHLISNTITLSDKPEYRKQVMTWARREAKKMQDIGIALYSPEQIASCYPLNPISLEVIPELCARYGQRERTLLSFISDSKSHTVATFIDENQWDVKPPTMGLDSIYDFFISGTSMIRSTSKNISRLLEIETIIRDAHGLNEIEKKTLKTIGILNLIGRSGNMRASRRMIDQAIGNNSIQILKLLEKKTMITYRKHADEYRIWHGTDIDIAAKLEMFRSRYRRMPLYDLLRNAFKPEPVVAARHSMVSGTMRLFERRFLLKPGDTIGNEFDGTILYSDDMMPISSIKPVIVISAGDSADLKSAAEEVVAIRDILESDGSKMDWVARKEFEERLDDAETILEKEFTKTYGGNGGHYTINGNDPVKITGTESSMASHACDAAYHQSPIIKNEMINRANLSSQGSSAKKALLEALILHHNEENFGLSGNGPEVAIYKAIFHENNIHRKYDGKWKITAPRGTMKFVWRAILDKIRKSNGRTNLSDIYKVASMPPYGVRVGPMQLLFVAVFIANRDNIALYEHGTFVPIFRPEMAERMTKNPNHFEVKYFAKSKSDRELLDVVSSKLDLSGRTVLDIVSYMVRTISILPQYVKSTKTFGRETAMVRDAIMNAREPDTLLFETLPKALGFKTKIKRNDHAKFARKLNSAIKELKNKFPDMIDDISKKLFKATGITDRPRLSKVATELSKHVTDQKIKVFIGTLSADVLEKPEDWINYIAMSITDVPPADWKDDQRTLFENNLTEFSFIFRRLAALHYSKISRNFNEKSCSISVTRSDGSEYHGILTLKPERLKKMQGTIAKMRKDLQANGLMADELEILEHILGIR